MNAIRQTRLGCIGVKLPLRLVSLTNQREHWATKARRAKAQRTPVALTLRAWLVGKKPPLEIMICRVAPRALDGDNLQAACKHVRDGVADALGVDDGHPGLTWRYEQHRGGPKEYAVIIEIAPPDAPLVSTALAMRAS